MIDEAVQTPVYSGEAGSLTVRLYLCNDGTVRSANVSENYQHHPGWSSVLTLQLLGAKPSQEDAQAFVRNLLKSYKVSFN